MDGYTQLYFLNKPKIADFILKKDYTFRNLSSKQANRAGEGLGLSLKRKAYK